MFRFKRSSIGHANSETKVIIWFELDDLRRLVGIDVDEFCDDGTVHIRDTTDKRRIHGIWIIGIDDGFVMSRGSGFIGDFKQNIGVRTGQGAKR